MCEEEQAARYCPPSLSRWIDAECEISELLRLTRLKVSRLLRKQAQSGIIRVQINSRFEGCLYENALANRIFVLQNIRAAGITRCRYWPGVL